jgi:hypothetical protein
MWSDPSLLRNNGRAVFSLLSVHGLYSSDVSRQLVSPELRGSYELVVGPSSSLQRRVAELQANGSGGIGRQETSEDSASVIVNCSEL